jgi:hypothetical protein
LAARSFVTFRAAAGRLTPDEAQTISAIVAKRAKLFPSIELASEIEALIT